MKPSPFQHGRMASVRALACAGIACGLALASAPARAQAPAVPPAAAQAAPAGAPPGGAYWRVAFFAFDQWAYTLHPYAQITGASAFNNGRAAFGSSSSFGTPASDSAEPTLVQLLHSLPPFAVEVGRPLTVFLPKAISLGLDYYTFSQEAASVGTTSATVPPIKTDTYLYQIGVRAFAFDPTQPGINYYLGIGLGTLQGKLTAQPLTGQSPTVISYGQSPTGATLLGLDIKGDSFGIRYELALISASQVSLDSNPYSGAAPRKIDFSGTITRIAVYYQF